MISINSNDTCTCPKDTVHTFSAFEKLECEPLRCINNTLYIYTENLFDSIGLWDINLSRKQCSRIEDNYQLMTLDDQGYVQSTCDNTCIKTLRFNQN